MEPARQGRDPLEPEERKRRFATWYAIGAGLLLLLLQSLWLGEMQTQTVSWSELERMLAEGKVAEVTVSQDTLRGRLKEPLPDGRREVAAVRVDPALADRLREKGVTVTGAPPPGFLSQWLSWLAPLLLFYLIWTFAFRHIAERQGLGGLMSIGKSRAKVYVETDTRVTFADVAGVDEAKAELQEVVAFLKEPQAYGCLAGRAVTEAGAKALPIIEELQASLRAELLPHQREEERALYPEAARRLGGRHPIGPLVRMHAAIEALAARIATLAAIARREEDAGARVAPELRRSLFALEALLSLHLAVEG